MSKCREAPDATEAEVQRRIDEAVEAECDRCCQIIEAISDSLIGDEECTLNDLIDAIRSERNLRCHQKNAQKK